MVRETDWTAHWRNLVEARQAEAEAAGAGQRGYWNRRAAGFKASLQGRSDDPFLDFLEPWLSPRKTVLDVGAGWGRHALPLASRVDWVTAIEPAEGMRELLEPAANLTVIASAWEDAEAAPADLVICCHVLYGVAEVASFLLKLETSARERVFVYMRDRPPPLPAEEDLAQPVERDVGHRHRRVRDHRVRLRVRLRVRPRARERLCARTDSSPSQCRRSRPDLTDRQAHPASPRNGRTRPDAGPDSRRRQRVPEQVLSQARLHRHGEDRPLAEGLTSSVTPSFI